MDQPTQAQSANAATVPALALRACVRLSDTFSTVLPRPLFLRVGRGLREVPGISMLARLAPGTASRGAVCRWQPGWSSSRIAPSSEFDRPRRASLPPRAPSLAIRRKAIPAMSLRAGEGPLTTSEVVAALGQAIAQRIGEPRYNL